MLWPTSAHTFC